MYDANGGYVAEVPDIMSDDNRMDSYKDRRIREAN